MPARKRSHLKRLSNVWLENPLYFITVCTAKRRPILLSAGIPDILVGSWQRSAEINGWVIGRYIVMPDHAHFFARRLPAGKTLNGFMRDWKRWTANQIIGVGEGLTAPVWQPEFFDHVLRSAGSYLEKWNYVCENPVRAGLAVSSEVWPYAGECEILSF